MNYESWWKNRFLTKILYVAYYATNAVHFDTLPTFLSFDEFVIFNEILSMR